jgi:hypothetical protein
MRTLFYCERNLTELKWPPQHPLPMWTSSNGLLKRPLDKFFEMDVKKSPLKMVNLSVTGL